MQVLRNLLSGFCFSVFIFLLVFIEIVTIPPSEQEMRAYLLHNIKLIEIGDYNQRSNCPIGQFVVGIRKRMLKEIGAVNEIVTGLEMTCSDRMETRSQKKFVHIFGKGGSWGEYLECPTGFGVGLALKVIYSRKETLEKKVGNVILHCSSVSNADLMESIFNTINKEKDFGFSYNFAQFCVNDEAMTEIRIRGNSEIEFYEGENVKLKNLDIDCRRVEDYPAKLCKLSIQWKKIPVQACSDPYPDKQGNSDSDYKVNCSFDARIGVDYNRDINSLPNILSSYHLLDGFIAFHTRYTLLTKLLNAQTEKKFSHEIDASLSQFVDESYWQSDQIVNVNFSQPFHRPIFMKHSHSKPKILINNTFFDLNNEETVQQLIGVCGIYVFKFDKFRSQHSVYFKTVVNDFPAKITFVNN